jgi:Zn-dependent protease
MGNDTVKLFRIAGIQVSIQLIWWIAAGLYVISGEKGYYHAPVWAVVEYISLFGIVLMHEFGHAFACRSVGGRADNIVLWPLGGVAYVQPPPRPGALLWCIAAGPLVNVALLPVTFGLVYAGAKSGLPPDGDLTSFLHRLFVINASLLVFNMLPVYPLDGGQILQSLLWFVVGRGRSILVASVIGMLGGAAGIVYAVTTWDIWLGLIGVFVIQRALSGFKYGKAMAKLDHIPRHKEFACPNCLEQPFALEKWTCSCGATYDPFANDGACPKCHTHNDPIPCPSCGQAFPFAEWKR